MMSYEDTLTSYFHVQAGFCLDIFSRRVVVVSGGDGDDVVLAYVQVRLAAFVDAGAGVPGTTSADVTRLVVPIAVD